VQSRLALEWREWMTSNLLGQYFADRSFYQLQAGALVDNPDQRIAADVRWVARVARVGRVGWAGGGGGAPQHVWGS
jgi:ABC-type uncharacterized transport system fused permease/ATPase subunit